MDGLVFSGAAQFAACCGVLVAAQFVYVLFGFGSGLVAVGGMSLAGLPVRDVVVLLLVVNLPIEVAVVARARRAVPMRSVLLVCAGLAVGVPLGTWILRDGEPLVLLAVLGVLLVATGLLFLALPDLRPRRWPAWAAPATGSVAGLLGALFGTAGPPVIVYYRLAGIPKTTFRATLMAIFLAITCARLPAYAFAGLITAPRLWSVVALAPAVVLGSWLGQRTHLDLPEARFRTLVHGALVAIGALLLVRALAGGA